MRTSWLVAVAVLLAAVACGRIAAEPSEPTVKTETVVYRHGEAVLEGVFASPEGAAGKRPGVLVVHAWRGIGPHETAVADRLARLGYVALCADVYGQGVRPSTNQEAAKEAGRWRGDRPALRARVAAGIARLREHPLVDPARVAAIGFCFGGGAVLELARSGAGIAGVVSFHGNLDTPLPAEPGAVRAKVLVLHGAADPHVPPEHVRAFGDEMHAAGADWQMILYGGAVHSFSDAAAGSDRSRGAAYDEKSARRSFAAMETFLREAFGE